MYNLLAQYTDRKKFDIKGISMKMVEHAGRDIQFGPEFVLIVTMEYKPEFFEQIFKGDKGE